VTGAGAQRFATPRGRGSQAARQWPAQRQWSQDGRRKVRTIPPSFQQQCGAVTRYLERIVTVPHYHCLNNMHSREVWRRGAERHFLSPAAGRGGVAAADDALTAHRRLRHLSGAPRRSAPHAAAPWC
jgi:hypothetical protein